MQFLLSRYRLPLPPSLPRSLPAESQGVQVISKESLSTSYVPLPPTLAPTLLPSLPTCREPGCPGRLQRVHVLGLDLFRGQDLGREGGREGDREGGR